MKWAKTTSWPHAGAVSPSRRAVPSGFLTPPLGYFGPLPGLLSGCAPFCLTDGAGAVQGALQDHLWAGTFFPGPSREWAGTPKPEVKSGKGDHCLRALLAFSRPRVIPLSPKPRFAHKRPIPMLLAKPQGAGFASETRVSITFCWVSWLLEDSKLLFVCFLAARNQSSGACRRGGALVAYPWPCRRRSERCEGEGARRSSRTGWSKGSSEGEC